MVEQLDRDAAESFYEGPCTRGLLETILSSHRIAAEARGMAEIERLQEALRMALAAIDDHNERKPFDHIDDSFMCRVKTGATVKCLGDARAALNGGQHGNHTS